MIDQYDPSSQKPPAPQRLFFLHGLFRKSYPHSGRTVAELLARGLGRAAVSAAPDLLLDDGGRCPRYLVLPGTNTAAWQPVEVVEVVYDDIIKERADRWPLIKRASIGVWALIAESPRLIRLFLPGQPRVTARQVRMAITMALVFIVAVCLTLAILALILYGAQSYLIMFLQWAGMLDRAGATAPSHLAGLIALVALVAVTGKLFVSKSRSETWEDAASAVFAAMDYHRPESQLRHALLRRVESALAAGSGCEDDRSVSILAFSQGTLLAIDALFPAHPVSGPELGSRPQVDLLVTLGCPLAISTRLWPAGPTRPTPCQAEVKRWINFYEVHDQLGGEIASLIKAEGIMIEVDDRQFSYADPAGRPSDLPHFSYWLDGPNDQRPTATQIAAELVRGSQAESMRPDD